MRRPGLGMIIAMGVVRTSGMGLMMIMVMGVVMFTGMVVVMITCIGSRWMVVERTETDSA